jgi:hypothetical protein
MPRFNDVVYGRRELLFFFGPLFQLTGDGFIHAGRHYRWEDLGTIQVTQVPQSLKGVVVYYGRADVHLADGTAVRFWAKDIVKRGALVSRDYQSAFDELVALFQEKRREHLKEIEAQRQSRDAA